VGDTSSTCRGSTDRWAPEYRLAQLPAQVSAWSKEAGLQNLPRRYFKNFETTPHWKTTFIKKGPEWQGCEACHGPGKELRSRSATAAEMIGTTRETVSRLFSEFKKKQLLQLKGSKLVIRNKPALEKLIRS
jgi:CRP-like cAMP-binding protein